MNPLLLKDKIKTDYSQIALSNEQQGAEKQRNAVCKPIYTPIEKQYLSFDGYIDKANLGLGCGFPFLYANLLPGQTVMDLGCAAGIDCFIASKQVGATGKVLGIDITPKLIERATEIAKGHEFNNVFFICNELESIPLPSNTADIILSNGVFSLISDLNKAFAEVYRLLKPNGIFCIADITQNKDFTDIEYQKIKNFTGCLNGIRLKTEYLNKLAAAGFENITVVEERTVYLPKDISNISDGICISTIKMSKKNT